MSDLVWKRCLDLNFIIISSGSNISARRGFTAVDTTEKTQLSSSLLIDFMSLVFHIYAQEYIFPLLQMLAIYPTAIL